VNDLGYLEALLLGVLQGATEFLPVSSSGHLAITEHLLGIAANSPHMLLFNVVAHVGTLVAVAWVFRLHIVRFVQRLWLESCARTYDRPVCGMLWHGIVATLITAGIGIPFQDTFEQAFGSLSKIGWFLVLTGLMLAGTRFAPRGRRGLRQLRWYHGVAVGLAQACAIFPGVSRSGATICMATFVGFRRRWAAEFSFLIAAPAILGGTGKKMLDTMALSPGELEGIPLGPIAVGGIISLLVGVVALRMLLTAVKRGQLHYYAVYCLALGAIVLLWG
jgi:undecaprenyl-diphosphatase